jgi:catechol 2,3-dioxygenase-like lactoylglutathione lyase family enzyme
MSGQAVGILHPVITVSAMDTALTFYRDLLGMTVVRDYVHDPAHLSTLLRVEEPDVRAAILRARDGGEIELVEFRSPRGRARNEKAFADAGHTMVTIIVDDIDATVARITGAGFRAHGPVVEYPEPDGTPRVVYVFGPDDTPLTLLQTP